MQPGGCAPRLICSASVTLLPICHLDTRLQNREAEVVLCCWCYNLLCCGHCVGVQAYVRYVDALYASGKFEEAAAALHQAVARDHTFKTIPEYKVGGSFVLLEGRY